MERLTYTVSEVAELLGISRSKAYDLVAAGLLPIVPLPGRRKLVARAVLERLVDAPGPAADRLTEATNGDQQSNGRRHATTTHAAHSSATRSFSRSDNRPTPHLPIRSNPIAGAVALIP